MRDIKTIVALSERVQATKRVVQDLMGTGRLVPYLKALKAHHDAYVAHEEAIHGPHSADAIRKAQRRIRANARKHLPKVGWE